MTNTSTLLQQLHSMTEMELLDNLYRDHLTGVFNRKAYETLASPLTLVAIIDLDSLKYLNDNYGHRTGDAQLKRLAAVLCQGMGKDSVYRISGDEFVVTSLCLRRSFIDALDRAQHTFPGMSYGVGHNLVEADDALMASKAAREASGERSPRGERPPWCDEIDITALVH